MGGRGMTRGRPHRCALCPKIMARYREGATVAEIAASARSSPQHVYNILRRHKVQLRDPRPLARASNAEILAIYTTGATASQIARRVGRSRERVRQILIQGGIARPDRRQEHTCTDACRTVLAASPPIVILRLAKQTGISSMRLAHAMRVHHVQAKKETIRRTHVCGVRCETFRQALVEGVSQSDAARRVGWPRSHGSGRLRVYHPDWPWPDAYHHSAPKMRKARSLIRCLVACHGGACGGSTCQIVVDAQAFLGDRP